MVRTYWKHRFDAYFNRKKLDGIQKQDTRMIQRLKITLPIVAERKNKIGGVFPQEIWRERLGKIISTKKLHHLFGDVSHGGMTCSKLGKC